MGHYKINRSHIGNFDIANIQNNQNVSHKRKRYQHRFPDQTSIAQQREEADKIENTPM